MKKFKGHTLKEAKAKGGYWARCHTSLKMSDGSWATYKGYYYECDSWDGYKFKTLNSNGQLDPVFCHDLTNEAFNYFDPIQLFDNGQVHPENTKVEPFTPSIAARTTKNRLNVELDGKRYYFKAFNLGNRLVSPDVIQKFLVDNIEANKALIDMKDKRVQELEETVAKCRENERELEKVINDLRYKYNKEINKNTELRADKERLTKLLNNERLDAIGLIDGRQKTIDEAVKLKREIEELKNSNMYLKIGFFFAVATIVGIITCLVTM